jgi:hypothetical protein
METLTMSAREAQRQYVEAVKRGQKAVMDAVGLWTRVLDASGSSSASTRLSSEPVMSPRDLVEGGFTIAERVIATQKEFALALVDAATTETR